MMTSTSWSTPSTVRIPVGVMRSIAGGLQHHVVTLEGPGPDAVVDGEALGAHGILRDHLLEQVGAVAELGLEVHRQQRPQLGAGRADGVLDVGLGQSGSTARRGSSPSWLRQKSRNRNQLA